MPTIAKRTIFAKHCYTTQFRASRARGQQQIAKFLNHILMSDDPMTAIENYDKKFLNDPQKIADFISAGGGDTQAYMYDSLFWLKQSNNKFRWTDHSTGRLLNFLVLKFLKLREKKQQGDPKILVINDQEVLVIKREVIMKLLCLTKATLNHSLDILKRKEIIWIEQYKRDITKRNSSHIFINWNGLKVLLKNFFLVTPNHSFLKIVVKNMTTKLNMHGIGNSWVLDVLQQTVKKRFPSTLKTAQLQKQARKSYKNQRQIQNSTPHSRHQIAQNAL